jgi:hypothetical protein
MNKILFVLLIAMTAVLSCSKEVEPGIQFSAYEYASLDLNGGDWKPVLLSNGAQIPVPTAETSGSAAFLAEVAAVKAIRNAVTTEQREAVNYWGANCVARWDIIASDMMAKYNLPPVANADGTYPVPNAATPDVYPYFPFANPPYASRAYAHFSAAMFDALIACWKAKVTNNRLAPYKYDNTIDPLVAKNDLPSYPSEDAVVAAVAEEVLSAFFPNEKNLLKSLSAEAKNSRLWAGANVQSDLNAGDSLGRAVAKIFIARSKTDGMKNAIGNQFKWDSLASAATARGDVPWKSLESPARPPMLPFFGQVKPWLIPSAAALRPGPPPAVGSPALDKDLAELREISKNLSSEQRAIAAFWADGPSTYTPPGHWNRISAETAVANKMNPLRTARVLAYVNLAMADGGIVCWDTKNYYYNPRPATVDPAFKTAIGVPNFPAYISGHSTFSSAAATVLEHIFPAEAAKWRSMAVEASESRIYGGIHYRVDCEVGLEVGKNIGVYAVNRAIVDGGE